MILHIEMREEQFTLLRELIFEKISCQLLFCESDLEGFRDYANERRILLSDLLSALEESKLDFIRDLQDDCCPFCPDDEELPFLQ